jgi:subtilisin family serine protease
MAAPHVAGAAALYLATFPSASPADVARALTSNATPGAVSGLQSGTPNLLLYTGFIGSSDPPPPPPPSPVLAAAFTYSCSNLVCGFDARASGGTSSSTIYRWTFGDGKSGQGPTISHKFPARRSYTVRLTLREPGKTNNSTSKAITCNGQRCS